MGIWIRSQDKTTLAYCTRLWINPNGSILNLPATGTEGCYDILGRYESKERALEILDDIQTQLISNTRMERGVNNDTIVQMFVYRMPKE